MKRNIITEMEQLVFELMGGRPMNIIARLRKITKISMLIQELKLSEMIKKLESEDV